MESLLNLYDGQGIYLTWDREYTGLTPVDHYRILWSTHRDGTFTALSDIKYFSNGVLTSGSTVPWPGNECLDQNTTASIENYYKIQEEDINNNVLATSPPIWGEETLLRASVAYPLDQFLRVPVYAEELHFINEERTIGYTASWGPWCYWERPRAYITRAPIGNSGFQPGAKDAYMILPQQGTTNLVTQVTPSGVAVNTYSDIGWYPDYNGRVYFVDSSGDPVSIDWYDSVLIDYQFRAFTTRHINQALFWAAGELISRPGISTDGRVENYGDLGNLPPRWDFILVAGACYWLLRNLAMMLLQRERRLVFLDPDGKMPDFSNLMESYRKQFTEAADKIALAERPSVRGVVTPEYALPGTRMRFFRMAFKGY